MCGSRDPLFEFWDYLISPDPLKLETSNLEMNDRELTKNAKLGQRCHVTDLCNFGTQLISRKPLKLKNLKFGKERDGSEY